MSGNNRTTERERARYKRDYICLYKESHCCEICSEARAVCLDFHHRDPDAKKFVLSDAETRSIANTVREIKKCILVCANCHRVIHADDARDGALKSKPDEVFPLFDLL